VQRPTLAQAAAVHNIITAWTDPGPSPHDHRMYQEALRLQWPSLATAVEQLVAAGGFPMPMPMHNHMTRDIKPRGSDCGACEEYWSHHP
jgi:hypothetical protein